MFSIRASLVRSLEGLCPRCSDWAHSRQQLKTENYMTMKMKLVAVATVAVAFLWSLPAHASTITVGFGAVPVVPAVGCGPDSSGVVTCIPPPMGSFVTNIATGVGNPPNTNPVLLGSTLTNITVG